MVCNPFAALIRTGVGALVRERYALMLKVIHDPAGSNSVGASMLDEIVRDGAQQMLAAALHAEVAAYVEVHHDYVDDDGRRLVVRNGYHQAREVTTAAGAVQVRQPRVNDRRIDEGTGQRRRFSSAILPAWSRKSPRVAEVLPLLYLHGLSTSDFGPALEQFLGSDQGLSAATITRLTGQWQHEARAFNARSVAGTDYIYCWVDGTGAAPEPRGVKNTSGITTISMGTNGLALTNYDPLIDAVGTLADNNEAATGAIYSPRTGRALAKLKDTTNQPLQVPQYLSGVTRYETNQIPTNLTQGTSNLASDVFTADWRELLVGLRTSFRVEVLRERYADTGSIGLLAWFRGDILAARPKSFVVTVGVL